MAIIINLDVILAKHKMSVTKLTEKVGITMTNISILKNGKAKAIRFSTLEAICKALDCQPGDILEYRGTTQIKNNLLHLTDKVKQKWLEIKSLQTKPAYLHNV